MWIRKAKDCDNVNFNKKTQKLKKNEKQNMVAVPGAKHSQSSNIVTTCLDLGNIKDLKYVFSRNLLSIRKHWSFNQLTTNIASIGNSKGNEDSLHRTSPVRKH